MKVNQWRFRVEWADCDPADIVFYPNYFRWMDTGTHHLFDAVGIDMMKMFEERDMIGIPIVDAQCSFKIPSTIGDWLTVESHIAEWRNKTFLIRHRFLKGADNAVALEGHELRIWGVRDAQDRKRLRAGIVPDEIRRLFG